MLSNPDVEDFLKHYGVKGMRWGVRNEDDTSSGNSSGGEKKPRFTDKQKKAMLIGAGVAGTVLVAYGTYKLADTGQLNAAGLRARQTLGRQEGPWKVNSKLADKNLDVDQLQELVNKGANPGYGTKPGTKKNCRRATFAYEMRRRGYDVSATGTHTGEGQNFVGMYNATRTDGGVQGSSNRSLIRTNRREERGARRGGATPLNDAFETFSSGGRNSITPKNDSMVSGIFGSLLGQPDGSRGEINMTWETGGRHSMAYEIVRGRPVVFDAQTGQRYLSARELRSDIGESIASAASTRLDNLPMNSAFLQRWLRNA